VGAGCCAVVGIPDSIAAAHATATEPALIDHAERPAFMCTTHSVRESRMPSFSTQHSAQYLYSFDCRTNHTPELELHVQLHQSRDRKAKFLLVS
jgi:hypothetical protein